MRRLALVLALALGVGAHRVDATWQARSGEAFRARAGALEQAPRKGNVITVDDRHFYFRELQTVGAEALIGPNASRDASVRPLYRDPIPVIADFRDRLAERDIALLVVPVPVRPWIHPDGLFDDGTRLHPQGAAQAWTDFVDAVRAEGIDVIDPLPILQSGANRDPVLWMSRADQHWTNLGMRAVTSAIAQRLRKRGLVSGTPRETTAELKTVTRKAAIGVQDGIDLGTETFEVRRIHDASGDAPPDRDPAAPIVVLGDSNIVWYSDWDAHLLAQLQHELGVSIDSVVVHGGGASRTREELVREDALDPGYLDRKRVVVWVFHGIGVQKHEWQVVPLEMFPPTRLEALAAPPRLATDQALYDGPGSLAGLSARFVPSRERGQPAWMNGVLGLVTFAVADGTAPTHLVFELQSRQKGPLQVELDGEPIATLDLVPGPSRHRVPLGVVPGRHQLGLRWKVPTNEVKLGIRSLHLVQGEPFASLDAETPGLGALPAEGAIALPDGLPEHAALRLHWMAGDKRCAPTVRIALGDRTLYRGAPDPWWHEVSVPLDGAGDGAVLRVMRSCADGSDRPAAVTLDRIEIDAI